MNESNTGETTRLGEQDVPEPNYIMRFDQLRDKDTFMTFEYGLPNRDRIYRKKNAYTATYNSKYTTGLEETFIHEDKVYLVERHKPMMDTETLQIIGLLILVILLLVASGLIIAFG